MREQKTKLINLRARLRWLQPHMLHLKKMQHQESAAEEKLESNRGDEAEALQTIAQHNHSSQMYRREREKIIGSGQSRVEIKAEIKRLETEIREAEEAEAKARHEAYLEYLKSKEINI